MQHYYVTNDTKCHSQMSPTRIKREMQQASIFKPPAAYDRRSIETTRPVDMLSLRCKKQVRTCRISKKWDDASGFVYFLNPPEENFWLHQHLSAVRPVAFQRTTKTDYPEAHRSAYLSSASIVHDTLKPRLHLGKDSTTR